MHTILKMKNEGLRRAALGFAEALIAAPSPSLEEGRVAELVEAEMRALGYHEVFRDDAGNVVGILLGREKGPVLLLNSHMDTVRPDNRAPVEMRPGRLYGPGAADCKAGLAAQVYAGALLTRSLLPLRGHLIVAATVAEENGASVGVHALMDSTLPEMGFHPDYAVLGEPTNLNLYYGHDGWMEMDIRLEGPDPFQVNDAARNIYNDYAARQGGAESTAAGYFEVQPPRFSAEYGGRRACVQMSRRLQPDTVPSQVLGQLDHDVALLTQFAPAVAVEVSVHEERQRLYNGATTQVRRITHAWATDPFDPLIERARQSLAAAGMAGRPGKWRLGRLGMGTAGGVLLNDYHVPTVGFGPGDEAQAHTPGECVETEKIVQAVYGTAAIAHGLVGIPVCGWTSDEI